MSNLKNTTALVKWILERDKKARNSDSYLYMLVLERVSPVSLSSGMTVLYFLDHMKELGAPPFESVRRARQKLQRKYPDLAPCEAVADARAVNELEYRAYAKEDI